jgi:hypothetical protein
MNVGKADFSGVEARLLWVSHALNTLDEDFRIWMREHNPSATSVEYYPEANVHAFRLEPQLPPIRFGVVASNIIHQLRATLDNLVWQLVIGNGKTPRRGVRGNQFPISFGLKEDATFADYAASNLRGFKPDQVAAVERLQPYMSPNWPLDKTPHGMHPLGRLNRLSNADKHQVLEVLDTNEASLPTSVRFESESIETLSIDTRWLPPDQRHPGAIVGWTEASPPGFHKDMHMAYGASGWLTFKDGLPVIPTLRLIMTTIEYCVVIPFTRGNHAGIQPLNPGMVIAAYHFSRMPSADLQMLLGLGTAPPGNSP